MKKTLLILGLILSLTIAVFATQVYFSPNGGCQAAIIREISKANSTIDIAMYYFTEREIAQELVKAKDRKVAIRVLLDPSQEKQKFSKSRYLLNKGITVKYDTGAGLMHNKFAIIDKKALITGSFNWTATAEARNAENLLIMNDAELISKYQARYEMLWNKGRAGGKQ
ncbi:MAG: phospholipase D family protein [Candidatus Margulisiibacteriota bacterium]|jgi:phosphatidylserine/phosphatidylglycerophosphate/cardiolipin synthase-like enzyme